MTEFAPLEPPRIMGIPVTYLSLLTLVLQNTVHVLCMRLSKTQSGPGYISSTAVVMTEVVKLVACLLVVVYEERSVLRALHTLRHDMVDNWAETLRLIVPSGLYTLQNNLTFVGIGNLEAATFQVTYQLKILTTAVFARLLLQKPIDAVKWIALVVLTVGVALVQFPPPGKAPAVALQGQDPVLGLLAVVAACFLSGFSGVYFERLLKGSRTSLWVRNIQLGMFGVLFGLGGMWLNDAKTISEHGFFYGYTPLTWAVILLSALGGLTVAVVIKYTDNILKGFATSIAIIVSSVLSIYLFGFQLHLVFCLGCACVIYAVYLYSLARPPAYLHSMADRMSHACGLSSAKLVPLPATLAPAP